MIMQARLPSHALERDASLSPFVWCRGRPFDTLSQPAVAICGSRRVPSQDARNAEDVARTLGRLFSARGYRIITGFAIGCDTWVMKGVEELGNLKRAIGVLPCGVDTIYPFRNSLLADKIVTAGGLMLSQWEPGTPPAPWRFPVRNNLIMSLSRALFVVYAGEHSGSMITARIAQDMDIPVFVPQRSLLRSPGTDILLDEGIAEELRPITAFPHF